MRSLSKFRSTALRLGSASAMTLIATVAIAKEAPNTNYPAPVAKWLEQAKQDCPSGFQANNPIETLSLTGDGRPGFIADPHKLTCAGEPHIFSGDGPASIELFVTLPSGELVHTGGVRALAYEVVSTQGGAPTLHFQTHEDGQRAGSVDAYRWDGHNFSLLNKSAMSAPPVNGPDKDYQK